MKFSQYTGKMGSGGKRSERTVRLGIIGAGAVAELCHLPAVKHCPEVGTVTLAEMNRERAAALANRFSVSGVVTDYRELFGRVDAVIVALPNYLHAPVAIEFLDQGIAVLVEKPMALTRADAEAMVAASTASRVALQVGLMYRYTRGARALKQAVDEAWLGNVTGMAVEWGCVFDWPATSGSFYRKDHAGGGVLVDFGSHMLDLVTWILGQPSRLAYEDDSLGGVEADCSVSLDLQHAGRVMPGTVLLSRLRNLRNTVRIAGDRFTVEYDVTTADQVRLWPSAAGANAASFLLDAGRRQSWAEVYAAQLRSFAQAVLTGSRPEVSGEDCLAATGLMERCYRERQPARLPWVAAAEDPVALQEAE
jgi:predicted dehydrogenase